MLAAGGEARPVGGPTRRLAPGPAASPGPVPSQSRNGLPGKIQACSRNAASRAAIKPSPARPRPGRRKAQRPVPAVGRAPGTNGQAIPRPRRRWPGVRCQATAQARPGCPARKRPAQPPSPAGPAANPARAADPGRRPGPSMPGGPRPASRCPGKPGAGQAGSGPGARARPEAPAARKPQPPGPARPGGCPELECPSPRLARPRRAPAAGNPGPARTPERSLAEAGCGWAIQPDPGGARCGGQARRAGGKRPKP